jgi:hypothetical protein
MKTTAQLIEELDTLRRLGWRNEVFIVDDNFIGNYRQALLLARDLAVWQQCHERPFSFYTEASVSIGLIGCQNHQNQRDQGAIWGGLEQTGAAPSRWEPGGP